MKDYTFEDFKGLIEKAFEDYKNPMNVPFGMDPYSDQAITYRNAKREVLNWVLEMMPDGFDIARHSKRLVEQLRTQLTETREDRNKLGDRYDDAAAKLIERDALLCVTKQCIERNDYPVFELLKRIEAALSASAEKQ